MTVQLLKLSNRTVQQNRDDFLNLGVQINLTAPAKHAVRCAPNLKINPKNPVLFRPRIIIADHSLIALFSDQVLLGLPMKVDEIYPAAGSKSKVGNHQDTWTGTPQPGRPQIASSKKCHVLCQVRAPHFIPTKMIHKMVTFSIFLPKKIKIEMIKKRLQNGPMIFRFSMVFS